MNAPESPVISPLPAQNPVELDDSAAPPMVAPLAPDDVEVTVPMDATSPIRLQLTDGSTTRFTVDRRFVPEEYRLDYARPGDPWEGPSTGDDGVVFDYTNNPSDQWYSSDFLLAGCSNIAIKNRHPLKRWIASAESSICSQVTIYWKSVPAGAVWQFTQQRNMVAALRQRQSRNSSSMSPANASLMQA